MFMFTIPDFSQIQMKGFFRFIEKDIFEKLVDFPQISNTEKEVKFFFGKNYKIMEPPTTERNAVYQRFTFSSKFYVPGIFIYWKQMKRKRMIYLGDIPLMNDHGTFVINGNYRVVVNQIIRSPGIYYSLEQKKAGNIYTGTLISDCGERLKFEIDIKKKLWVRISRKKKVSILVFLFTMGLKIEEVLYNTYNLTGFEGWELIWNEKMKQKLSRKGGPILTFYEELESMKCDSSDFAFSEFLYKKLTNFISKRCELGRIGRRNLNQKLNLDIPDNEIFLLPQDVLAIVDYLIKVSYGLGTIDNIDHLQNRHFCSVSDFLKKEVGLALNRVKVLIQKNMQTIEILENTQNKQIMFPEFPFISTQLTRTLKHFFGLHPLSQFLEQTNPLAEILHGRKVSFLGPGGLTERTASFRARDIHPSYYGRFCPINTPEGQNAGLIASLANSVNVDDFGFLKSPFYNVTKKSNEDHMVSYLLPNEDKNYRIALENLLAVDHKLPEKKNTPTQYRQDFLSVAWEQIHFRSILPLQYFSIGVSLIPFLEHNDATRALMGSNMQRQAVPLLQPEKCIVGTGLEGQVALDSRILATSIQEGRIEYFDSKTIVSSLNRKTIETILEIYQRSNSNILIHQKPQVNQGNYVKRGQFMADGSTTIGGELCLGKNILVAYMPWQGYNFEDAILINERLIYEEIFTSFHITRYETMIYMAECEILTKEIPQIEAYSLRHLDENGIVRVGSWIQPGDVLVGKLKPRSSQEVLRFPELRLLQDLFCTPRTKETCLKANGKGRVIDVNWIKLQTLWQDNLRKSHHEDDDIEDDFEKNDQTDPGENDSEKVHVYILQKRKIQVGDKVAGRHGNKGIISKVLSRQEMPFLQNGKPVDMILNPLGVPSRMNVGQIFECLLGLAGTLMNKQYRIPPFDERYEQEASRKLVFNELHKASEQTVNPWVFELEHLGKTKIFDGKTGEILEQPVTVGKAYMMKLIHQVYDKMHARSTGSYARITQQPVQGKSKGGGQRLGEMEVWALESFGVASILQEMLTVKSDHLKTRTKILRSILDGHSVPKAETATESFRVLIRELRSLALELNHTIISEKNFQIENKFNFNQIAYD
uniref:DNA-directed RNA polymerase subunit beta n=13 Tax=Ephedra TaxID=3387 RepID=A0A7T0PA33_9SPER|nr:RNA polymerase beta chain [Ephedra equisetina]YP_010048916.1 RNA polymerase beta subunit [Ephedra monosperma]YP_010451837.1 RNA polymerase beta subunit [Ephedra alata]YP_010452105.1 RNA polymerase beta subunit [Ephedra antisyphilitica]YP_010452440.1 RNA polymerase beta subunit [Ephedra coryi]YP_010452574.1 RNA polymerase beta subunit [Ephedra fedtschenkoae]YP_010452707.1 RNA polymerase beta subunit [Ephedra fragilis]YP_010452908.1 RNA polymerase beta subunit [Ephedra gerardiana]YP_010452